MKKKTIVLNPRNDKKLLIIAGTHGNETLAVRLLAQLQDDLSKNKILFNDVGVITIANMFNESGLRNNSREWVDETQDSDDLNRSFTNGTPTGMDDAIIEMKSINLMQIVNARPRQSLLKSVEWDRLPLVNLNDI